MFCENVRSLWVLSANYSAYFTLTIAAESLMWFWPVVNIKHHIARVVFASATSYQRCLGGKSAKTLNWGLFDAEMKLRVLFSLQMDLIMCIKIFQNQAFWTMFLFGASSGLFIYIIIKIHHHHIEYKWRWQILFRGSSIKVIIIVRVGFFSSPLNGHTM